MSEAKFFILFYFIYFNKSRGYNWHVEGLEALYRGQVKGANQTLEKNKGGSEAILISRVRT